MTMLMTCYLLNRTTMFIQNNQQNVASSLKASIQDLARLNHYYNPSDEMLWTFFNERVLLNQPIKVDEFVVQRLLSGDPDRHIPAALVG